MMEITLWNNLRNEEISEIWKYDGSPTKIDILSNSLTEIKLGESNDIRLNKDKKGRNRYEFVSTIFKYKI